MTFRVTSNPALLDFIRAQEVAAARAVAEEVLKDSKKRVPLDSGELQSSGQVTVRGQKASVTFTSPYAVRQHEDMTARHEGGRSAKYLELAGDQVSSSVVDIVARKLRDG